MLEIRYKYTDDEIKELLTSLVVLVDSREKANSHILSYLKGKGIKYEVRKLDHSDYSCYIPSTERNKELGIMRDLTLEGLVGVERKGGGLNELATDFTKGRTQIENQFIKATSRGGKLYLAIEGNTYEDLLHGRYRSKYNAKSFVATLKAFQCRYNLSVEFIDKKYSPNSIYYTLYYYARELLKYGAVGQVI